MVADSAVPSALWVWIHTEMSWTELDTLKLADRKPVSLLEAL